MVSYCKMTPLMLQGVASFSSLRFSWAIHVPSSGASAYCFVCAYTGHCGILSSSTDPVSLLEHIVVA